jgi:hypothetical protein
MSRLSVLVEHEGATAQGRICHGIHPWVGHLRGARAGCRMSAGDACSAGGNALGQRSQPSPGVTEADVLAFATCRICGSSVRADIAAPVGIAVTAGAWSLVGVLRHDPEGVRTAAKISARGSGEPEVHYRQGRTGHRTQPGDHAQWRERQADCGGDVNRQPPL